MQGLSGGSHPFTGPCPPERRKELAQRRPAPILCQQPHALSTGERAPSFPPTQPPRPVPHPRRGGWGSRNGLGDNSRSLPPWAPCHCPLPSLDSVTPVLPVPPPWASQRTQSRSAPALNPRRRGPALRLPAQAEDTKILTVHSPLALPPASQPYLKNVCSPLCPSSTPQPSQSTCNS